MLKKLRNKKTAKKIWIGLCILILPAFIFWGSGSLMRNRQEAEFAGRIFGRKIPTLEYQDALAAARTQAIIQYGDKFNEMQPNLNLESQAWERLILLEEAKKRKIKVSDREVMALLEKYDFFQRRGKFDNAIYSEMVRYIFRTQPRIFEEQMRQNIMLTKLYERVAGSLTLTDEEIKEEYRKANEEISIYYIASLYSDFTKDVSASVEDSKDYFLANPLEFKQPLSFNIEYMVLTLDDQDTKEIKDKIKDLLLRLTNKEDFKKVAQDFKLSVKETGLFKQTDSIPGIGWSPEIINLISKARVDEILPPIHLDKNYYIIKLKERKEPYIPDFEQVKDQVKEAVTKDKSQKIAKEKIDNCLAKLKEAYQSNSKVVNFDKIANECGLKSDTTGLFKYGSYIEGIGASDNFWLESQKLKDEEFSEIIEVPSGFYIIKPKSKIPVDEKQFQKDKKEFTESLLTQKRSEYFAQFERDLIHKSQN